MKRHPFLAAALLLAGCASAPPPKPPTPAELLMAGPWTCQTSIAQTAAVNAQMTYAAGGAVTFHVSINGGQGAFKIEADGDGAGTWKLSDDSKQLTSGVTSLKITSAKLNGAVVDAKLVQGMADQMLVGQSATTNMTISQASLTLAQPDGTASTTCTR